MGYPDTGTVEVPSNVPALANIVRAVLTDPDNSRDELVAGLTGGAARDGHLCVNAWVFDRDLTRVLLVEHPRFGWTIPGGHLDPGEDPATGAAREVLEETGLGAEALAADPVALVSTQLPETASYRTHMHYTLSYAFAGDPTAPLTAEDGQPVAWFPLDEPLPEGFFGDNWHAHGHVRTLRTTR